MTSRSATPPILPAQVRGPRLVLRCWAPDDAEALAEAVTVSLDHLRPWMPWIAHEPVALAARVTMIQEWERVRLAGGDVVYGMFGPGGEVVGGTGLHRRRGPRVLEVGYWVHVDHVGQGYATEAATVLTDLALSVEGIDRVEIHHDRANAASRRVPESLGFTLVAESPDEAVAPGEEGVDCTWAVDAATWRSRRP